MDKERVMSIEELREYIRTLPDDEIVRITFEEAANGGDREETETV